MDNFDSYADFLQENQTWVYSLNIKKIKQWWGECANEFTRRLNLSEHYHGTSLFGYFKSCQYTESLFSKHNNVINNILKEIQDLKDKDIKQTAELEELKNKIKSLENFTVDVIHDILKDKSLKNITPDLPDLINFTVDAPEIVNYIVLSTNDDDEVPDKQKILDAIDNRTFKKKSQNNITRLAK